MAPNLWLSPPENKQQLSERKHFSYFLAS